MLKYVSGEQLSCMTGTGSLKREGDTVKSERRLNGLPRQLARGPHVPATAAVKARNLRWHWIYKIMAACGSRASALAKATITYPICIIYYLWVKSGEEGEAVGLGLRLQMCVILQRAKNRDSKWPRFFNCDLHNPMINV